MIGECISTTLFILIQVIVSGKLRAQRAKSMKFKDGYMISSGQPVNEYIDSAVRHVLLRQVCFPVITL
jgi:small subunit ribosomal protein S3e